MNLVPLNTIFNIQYGNQLDFAKMSLADTNGERINFVSRASKNFGIIGRVSKYKFIDPFSPGLITVTLGGSYLLAAFIQPQPFYTAQNVKVLSPKVEMSFNEKLFYCLCIQENRFKYSSHGREANTSLDSLLVPERMDKRFSEISLKDIVKKMSQPFKSIEKNINIKHWQVFSFSDLFEIYKGQEQIQKCTKGDKPLVSATGRNNGIVGYVEGKNLFNKNSITVAMNGVSTGEAFYQEKDFFATSDVNILIPKIFINKYSAFFICTVIRQEKFRFSYGRKWSKEKMKNHKIKLPAINGQPDFNFMEEFIKSLPYSNSI